MKISTTRAAGSGAHGAAVESIIDRFLKRHQHPPPLCVQPLRHGESSGDSGRDSPHSEARKTKSDLTNAKSCTPTSPEFYLKTTVTLDIGIAE